MIKGVSLVSALWRLGGVDGVVVSDACPRCPCRLKE
jgi:hypothetical protein